MDEIPCPNGFAREEDAALAVAARNALRALIAKLREARATGGSFKTRVDPEQIRERIEDMQVCLRRAGGNPQEAERIVHESLYQDAARERIAELEAAAKAREALLAKMRTKIEAMEVISWGDRPYIHQRNLLLLLDEYEIRRGEP